MLAFGRFDDWVALSNLLGDRSRQDEHAKQVLDAISKVGPKDLEVLVSHGVTINAFLGEYLQQGEMILVRPAGRRLGGNEARPGAAGAPGAGSREAGPDVEVVGRLMVR
jgi:hypothetical protein